MAQRRPENLDIPSDADLLAAARRRATFPEGDVWLDYQPDVDTLYVRLKKETRPTRSESDLDNMLVFDYEGDQFVGIEIMDIYGLLEHANPK